MSNFPTGDINILEGQRT